jgi:hypothetical protein
MDIYEIIRKLHSEREEIVRVMTALEKINGKRRGRRPKWMKAVEELTEKKKQAGRSMDEES